MAPERRIAQRAARELKDGDIVNLGIGIPLLVAEYIPPGVQVHLQTENGLLGMGPPPPPDQVDPQIVNAAKRPVSELPGATYFDSAASFAIIRGAHVDVALLGALEVDEQGFLANWALPGHAVLGVGGAMDLVMGARRVIVLMTHRTKNGAPKLVRRCTAPLTGIRRVDMVITEYAVFQVRDGRLVLTELMDGTTLDWVRQHTAASFDVSLERGAA